MKRILAFAGFLAVFPFFVSRRSRVVRSIWIDAEPGEIFPHIDRLQSWPLWTAWGCGEAMSFRYEGPERGEGAVQHWSTPQAEGTLRVIGSVKDRHVGFSMEADGGRCSLEGVVTLAPVGKGTRVLWACWWVGGENPYARYLDLFLRWRIGRDYRRGLENLKRLIEGGSAWPGEGAEDSEESISSQA